MTADLHRERVDLPGRPTDIRIGSGLRRGLVSLLAEHYPRAWRVGLVIDSRVARLWPPELPEAGPSVLLVEAPAGEASKTRRVLARLQDRLLGLTRDEPVVVIGGGAVLDAAGFAAATVRRGLDWIAVPTTVLAMADASVGGKVAINHPKGKNLIGTFHPPRLVLADVDYLTTLEPRSRSAGLAEVYKAARIGDADLLEHLRRGMPDSPSAWADTLARSIAIKARIVEADERDAGPRRALNYGHTVGHALERLLGPEVLQHGEAVAIGMGAAARIARARGLVDARECERQDADLARLGLPVALPGSLDVEGLLEILALDKKRRPGLTHTFVLPRGECGVEILEDVTEEEIRRALGA